MTVNPITFLLGAGASFPFGVPMMAGFYSAFRTYLARRHHHCFEFLERLERDGGHATPDLETLLSDLNSVVGLERGLTLLGIGPSSHTCDMDVARELRGYLDAFIVDTCERFDQSRSALELQPLLRLRELGPLWLFTTNYDRTVEHACEQNAIPWTDGFECAGGQAVADWTGKFEVDVQVVKLHGSVNWYFDDPDGTLHRLDRGYSLPAHDFALVRRGQTLRPLMIIPTLEKDALGTPYIELSVRFTDALRESRLLIIAGNSLRDRHIRDYIRARMTALNVLLVSPSATARRTALRLPDSVCAIDAGFSEFLAIAGNKLLELGRTLQTLASTDTANRSAVEAFVTSIAQDTLDESAIQQDSELYRLWAASRSAAVAERVQAVRQLASYQHPAVTRRLQRLLSEDQDSHVRVACVTALTHTAGDGTATILANALAKEQSAPVQIELALALCNQFDGEPTRNSLRQVVAQSNLSSVARSVVEEHLANTPTPAPT